MRNNYGVLELNLTYNSNTHGYDFGENEEKALIKLLEESNHFKGGKLKKHLILNVVTKDNERFIMTNIYISDDHLTIASTFIYGIRLDENTIAVFEIDLDLSDIENGIGVTSDLYEKEFTPAE